MVVLLLRDWADRLHFPDSCPYTGSKRKDRGVLLRRQKLNYPLAVVYRISQGQFIAFGAFEV